MKFGFSMGHQRPMAIFTSILLTKSETPWGELNSALQSTSSDGREGRGGGESLDGM